MPNSLRRHPHGRIGSHGRMAMDSKACHLKASLKGAGLFELRPALLFALQGNVMIEIHWFGRNDLKAQLGNTV